MSEKHINGKFVHKNCNRCGCLTHDIDDGILDCRYCRGDHKLIKTGKMVLSDEVQQRIKEFDEK